MTCHHFELCQGNFTISKLQTNQLNKEGRMRKIPGGTQPPLVAFDPLDPVGNITIKWDVISSTPDGYVVELSLPDAELQWVIVPKIIKEIYLRIEIFQSLQEKIFPSISQKFLSKWMLDPGIKHETGYFVYESGSEKDIWVQKADGKPFVGKVWPRPCVFPDFTQEKARLWWAKLVRDFISNGVDGIWNDINEPAVFKSITKTMPESNIHRGDAELGGHQNHLHYHNVYGMLMARSTYEGMKLANPNKRAFVMIMSLGPLGRRYHLIPENYQMQIAIQHPKQYEAM